LQDLRRVWLRSRWEIISIAGVVALALGWWGFDEYLAGQNKPHPLPDSLYRALCLFVFEGGDIAGDLPIPLQVARFLAPLVVFAAAVGAAMSVLHREVQRFVAHRVMKDHVVVVGLGGRGLQLARQLVETGGRCAIVDVVGVEANSTSARLLGIPVVTSGEADPDLVDTPQMEELLRRAGIHRAASVVVMTGSPPIDARVANVLYNLQDEGDAPANAFIEIDDVDGLRSASGLALAATGGGLQWFSLADRAAKSLLDKLDELLAVKDGQAHRHLVVVGATSLGRSVIVQAARNWSRDLSRRQRAGRQADRLVLTLVEPSSGDQEDLDRARDDELQLLQRRDPRVPSPRSTSGELHVEICDIAATRLDEVLVTEPSAVIVTADHDRELLRRSTEVTRSVDRSVPVWLCTERSGGIVDVVTQRYRGVRGRYVDVFHVLDTVLREDGIRRGTDEELARAVHQAHRRYRIAVATQLTDVRTGVEPWDELSPDLRSLNYAAVAAWRQVLSARKYKLVPYTTPGAESIPLPADLVKELAVAAHEAWSAEKKNQGYRRGRARNDDPKRGDRTHPEVGLEFSELSTVGQEWNLSQARAVPEHLAAAGLQLYPLPGEQTDVTPTPATIEALAVAIHELYRGHIQATAPDHAPVPSWEELAEPLRESNRAAARALPDQLGTAGYRLQVRSGEPDAVTELPAETVEQLAEAEHERWMGEKRTHGYVHGPRNDDATPPTHPDMVPWPDLDEPARAKDRIRFTAAPTLLTQVGYEIAPDTPS
jgi:hypothetical protein